VSTVESTARPRLTAELREQLYVRFATGAGATRAQRIALADEFGLRPTTVDYHWRVWAKAQREQAASAAAPKVAAGACRTAAEPDELASAPPAEAGVANPEASKREAPATEPTTPEPPPPAVSDESQGEPTAMAEAFLRAGLVTPAYVAAAMATDLPEVGSIEEGVVLRVDDRYVLVRLIDRRDHHGRRLIGKVSLGETADSPPRSCHDLGWREGDLLYVKVLSLTWRPERDRLYIGLSVRKAPPHPHGPTRVQPMEPEGLQVAGAVAADLCATCAHGLDRFCPYTQWMLPTYQIPDEELPERHRGRRIVFGPRPVIACDLYRTATSA